MRGIVCRHDRNHARQQGCDRNRGGIVEQALAFDQPNQPRRRATALEQADDGGRIGGADDRTEQEAGDQSLPAGQVSHRADAQRCRDHGADGQQQDWAEVGDEP
jgi:hypothetical protein